MNLLGTLDWIDGAALIRAELPTDQSTNEEQLLALANAALVGAQYAALDIVEASITSALSAWPAGGAIGLLAGSQVGKDAHPLVRLLVAGVVGAIGAAATSQIRTEIPTYRLVAQADGRLVWQPIPLWTAAPLKLALP
jgi:hypothetical protein